MEDASLACYVQDEDRSTKATTIIIFNLSIFVKYKQKHYDDEDGATNASGGDEQEKVHSGLHH